MVPVGGAPLGRARDFAPPVYPLHLLLRPLERRVVLREPLLRAVTALEEPLDRLAAPGEQRAGSRQLATELRFLLLQAREL